jgi:hypothetical protein
VLHEFSATLCDDLVQDAEKLGAKTLVLPSSHLPMLSQPYEVADFIEKAASQLGLTE